MNKTILRLAIPNIISNLSVPMLTAVDVWLMGHQASPSYLNAIALGGIIFNFLYWNMSFLRMGTTGLTAQAYGAEDEKNMLTVLSQAMIVGLFSGILMLGLMIPIEYIGFALLNDASAETADLAREYYRIRIWAAPATVCLYSLNGWFLGMQNARFPMFITIVINLINVVLNFYFVQSMGMFSDGIALATVIAQYTGFVLAIGLLWWEYRHIFKHFSLQLLQQAEALQRFLVVNRDIFIRTFCLFIAFAFFTDRSSGMGDDLFAVNNILMQYVMILSFAIDGFAYAAESLTGRFVGAKDAVKFRLSIRYNFYWAGAIALFFTLTYWIGGAQLVPFFTDNSSLIEGALPYLPWVYVLPLVSTAAFLWDGIYIGATASAAMRNSMIVATFLFYLPLYFLLDTYTHWGNHALWCAFVVFMFVRALSLTWMAKGHLPLLKEE